MGMSQTGAAGLARHGYSAAQILTHYYTGTQLGRIEPGRVVFVLLQSGLRSAAFSGATDAGGRRLGGEETYVVQAAGRGRIALVSGHGRLLGHLRTPLELTGTAPITLAGAAINGISNGRYRGRLEIVSGAHGLRVINRVPLEEYLLGVVPAESPSYWPAAELEAQAIAARSFAVTSAPRHGFDLYADTRSQMYAGVSGETPATDAAVAATAGEVVTYDGAPVTTFYFASSGGRTEDVQNAFIGAAPEPYLASVADPFDGARFGPVTMSLRAASAKLRGLVRGRLRSIVVLRRGASPRVVKAALIGTRGTTRIDGPTLAAALDLHSTWLCFTVVGSSARPAAGWDAACRDRAAAPVGASGPTGATGPTETGATGGAVAPSATVGPRTRR